MAKPAKKTVKSKTAKSATLPAKPSKPYTKAKLIAHLAESVSNAGFGPVSKKQAGAFIEQLHSTLLSHAPVGAPLPGIGKLIVVKTKARKERVGKNPRTGEPQTFPAKPAGQKLKFRVLKAASLHFKK